MLRGWFFRNLVVKDDMILCYYLCVQKYYWYSFFFLNYYLFVFFKGLNVSTSLFVFLFMVSNNVQCSSIKRNMVDMCQWSLLSRNCIIICLMIHFEMLVIALFDAKRRKDSMFTLFIRLGLSIFLFIWYLVHQSGDCCSHP